MAGEAEGFKITDRRGLQRDFTDSPAPSLAPPPPEPGPPPSADRGAAHDHGSTAEGDLAGVFIMFASSALIGLGAAPDPTTGQSRPDLSQAQDAIETLLLLRAKTEGNRTEQETRLLEDILYDLQMRFVQATKRAGRPA